MRVHAFAEVGLIDKDCVCQCLLVSTMLDTKGWMT